MPSIITRTTPGFDASVKGLPLTNAEIDSNFIAINEAIKTTGDLTGFVDRTSSTITFSNSTRILELAPVSDTFTVYFKGREIIVPSPIQLELQNTDGGRWITLDPNALTLIDSGATIDITDSILVAYVYWVAGFGAIIAGDERHLASRDTQWHLSKHNEVGTTWLSGGNCTYALNNQTSISLGFSDVTIADEDLVHNITHASSPNGYYQQVLSSNAVIPVIYKSGTAPAQASAANPPWQIGLTAKYNQIASGNGSLVDIPSGSYVNYWIVATNDMVYPIKAVVGKAYHSSLMLAMNETFDVLDLPFEEMVVMYQVTLHTNTSYTNKVVISSVRKISSQGNVLADQILNGPSHAGLSKLSDDDHLQYMHIANSRTISATHTFNGVQTFTNGIKINTKPTVGLDGANKNYVDQQALLMAFLNA